MDSKIVEWNKCFLERSHDVSIELNTWLNQGFVSKLYRQTQIVRSTRKKTGHKHDNKDFFISLLNAYNGCISVIANSTPGL